MKSLASASPSANALTRRCGATIFIVSHKTKVAKEGRADMHQATLGFMRSRVLFAPAEAGAQPGLAVVGSYAELAGLVFGRDLEEA